MSEQSEFFAYGYRFTALDDVEQAKLEHQKQVYIETKLPRENARSFDSLTI